MNIKFNGDSSLEYLSDVTFSTRLLHFLERCVKDYSGNLIMSEESEYLYQVAKELQLEQISNASPESIRYFKNLGIEVSKSDDQEFINLYREAQRIYSSDKASKETLIFSPEISERALKIHPFSWKHNKKSFIELHNFMCAWRIEVDNIIKRKK